MSFLRNPCCDNCCKFTEEFPAPLLPDAIAAKLLPQFDRWAKKRKEFEDCQTLTVLRKGYDPVPDHVDNCIQLDVSQRPEFDHGYLPCPYDPAKPWFIVGLTDWSTDAGSGFCNHCPRCLPWSEWKQFLDEFDNTTIVYSENTSIPAGTFGECRFKRDDISAKRSAAVTIPKRLKKLKEAREGRKSSGPFSRILNIRVRQVLDDKSSWVVVFNFNKGLKYINISVKTLKVICRLVLKSQAAKDARKRNENTWVSMPYNNFLATAEVYPVGSGHGLDFDEDGNVCTANLVFEPVDVGQFTKVQKKRKRDDDGAPCITHIDHLPPCQFTKVSPRKPKKQKEKDIFEFPHAHGNCQMAELSTSAEKSAAPEQADFLRVRTVDGGTVLFIPSLLKEHPLVGKHCDSQVFCYLSGLEQHPCMEGDKNKSMKEKVEAMFKNFKIYEDDWDMLTKTLRLLSTKTIFHTDMSERVVSLASKLGMLGVVDKLSELQDAIQNAIPRMYNPKKPEYDSYKVYDWALRDQVALTEDDEWTPIEKIDGYQIWLCRKKKDPLPKNPPTNDELLQKGPACRSNDAADGPPKRAAEEAAGAGSKKAKTELYGAAVQHDEAKKSKLTQKAPAKPQSITDIISGVVEKFTSLDKTEVLHGIRRPAICICDHTNWLGRKMCMLELVCSGQFKVTFHRIYEGDVDSALYLKKRHNENDNDFLGRVLSYAICAVEQRTGNNMRVYFSEAMALKDWERLENALNILINDKVLNVGYRCSDKKAVRDSLLKLNIDNFINSPVVNGMEHMKFEGNWSLLANIFYKIGNFDIACSSMTKKRKEAVNKEAKSTIDYVKKYWKEFLDGEFALLPVGTKRVELKKKDPLPKNPPTNDELKQLGTGCRSNNAGDGPKREAEENAVTHAKKAKVEESTATRAATEEAAGASKKAKVEESTATRAAEPEEEELELKKLPPMTDGLTRLMETPQGNGTHLIITMCGKAGYVFGNHTIEYHYEDSVEILSRFRRVANGEGTVLYGNVTLKDGKLYDVAKDTLISFGSEEPVFPIWHYVNMIRGLSE